MQFRQCSVNGVKLVDVNGTLCVQPDIPNVQPAPVSHITVSRDFLDVLTLFDVALGAFDLDRVFAFGPVRTRLNRTRPVVFAERNA